MAVVGVIVWVVAPQFVLGAIPLLILLTCPLSMLFMMLGMQGRGEKTQEQESLACQITEMEKPDDAYLFMKVVILDDE